MSAHTEGPWNRHGLFVYDRYGNYVAQVNLDDEDPEAIANTALIAAAPDLLAVAKHAQEWTDPESVLGVRLAEAIAKATGEPA